MNDEQLQYLLNYDYTEIEKIPSQISSIDQTTKSILEELQKESPLETSEPTEFEMKVMDFLEEEQTHEIEVQQTEQTSDEIVVDPVEEEATPEEVTTDEVEEVTEEPPPEEIPLEEEEQVDYLQLLYQEMKTQNELDQQNQTAIIEHLEIIEEQGIKSNEVDGMAGLYMMYLIPLAVVVSLGSKVLNPFVRG